MGPRGVKLYRTRVRLRSSHFKLKRWVLTQSLLDRVPDTSELPEAGAHGFVEMTVELASFQAIGTLVSSM